MVSCLEIIENKNTTGLGFQHGPFNSSVKAMEQVFRSGEFIHGDEQHLAAIIEDNNEDEACANFVTHRQTCNNWVAVDVPIIIHRSK